MWADPVTDVAWILEYFNSGHLPLSASEEYMPGSRKGCMLPRYTIGALNDSSNAHFGLCRDNACLPLLAQLADLPPAVRAVPRRSEVLTEAD